MSSEASPKSDFNPIKQLIEDRCDELRRDSTAIRDDMKGLARALHEHEPDVETMRTYADEAHESVQAIREESSLVMSRFDSLDRFISNLQDQQDDFRHHVLDIAKESRNRSHAHS
ncbi:Uu.00g062540.m01.CDS01 [Anthostomella pinea]|uniref:Uu.00g062540.m01.CDS01 n=1 Tax=Anthostomella pinea TaxID=933095 RepID=A0AAI8VT87_9PEZI|nr:Uu.00g062540.m01.CDS01 [Anthostomella pinea]